MVGLSNYLLRNINLNNCKYHINVKISLIKEIWIMKETSDKIFIIISINLLFKLRLVSQKK